MMKINCDLGEDTLEIDAALMPLVDQASIACGGHAGDTASMKRCVALAKTYGVELGAHPSYPDREGFGRRTLAISTNTLLDSLRSQILHLSTLCAEQKLELSYIKPHGALYHDQVSNMAIFEVLLDLAAITQKKFSTNSLSLMVPAGLLAQAFIEKAYQKQVPLIFEGFADRVYADNGKLIARQRENALHADSAAIVNQALALQNGGVFSFNKIWLPMDVQSICIHSDTPNAVLHAQALRDRISPL